MSQAEIVKFLEKHPDKWFNYKELSEESIYSRSSLSVSLRKLRNWHLIDYKEEIVNGYRIYVYKAKAK